MGGLGLTGVGMVVAGGMGDGGAAEDGAAKADWEVIMTILRVEPGQTSAPLSFGVDDDIRK